MTLLCRNSWRLFLEDIPLDKDLSTSTWHEDRTLSPPEIEYAGNDAYAGLKLYYFFDAETNMPTIRFIDFRARGDNRVEPDAASLYHRLTKLRLQLTADPEARIYQVGRNSMLEDIALQRPITLTALKRVAGLKPRAFHNYGQAIVDAVKEHLEALP